MDYIGIDIINLLNDIRVSHIEHLISTHARTFIEVKLIWFKIYYYVNLRYFSSIKFSNLFYFFFVTNTVVRLWRLTNNFIRNKLFVFLRWEVTNNNINLDCNNLNIILIVLFKTWLSKIWYTWCIIYMHLLYNQPT